MSSGFGDVLARRRMCRDFEPTALDAFSVESVLDAATRAPSAGNTHALDVVVLQGSETARYWDVTLPDEARSSFRWPGLLRAPVLLVPYTEPDAYARRYSEEDKSRTGLGDPAAWAVPYWFVDGGAAVMAMLLAAESLGLGALLFGQFGHEDEVRAALEVPRGRRALGTMALGHPRRGSRSASRSAARGRQEVSDMAHLGGW